MREQCGSGQQFLEYPSMCTTLKPESKIFIADGLLALSVTEIVDDKNLLAIVLNDATIGSRKNCNLPGAIVDLPAVSEKDRSDLQFGVKNKVIFCVLLNVIYFGNCYLCMLIHRRKAERT